MCCIPCMSSDTATRGPNPRARAARTGAPGGHPLHRARRGGVLFRSEGGSGRPPLAPMETQRFWVYKSTHYYVYTTLEAFSDPCEALKHTTANPKQPRFRAPSHSLHLCISSEDMLAHGGDLSVCRFRFEWLRCQTYVRTEPSPDEEAVVVVVVVVVVIIVIRASEMNTHPTCGHRRTPPIPPNVK